MLTILFLGDVFGKKGIRAIQEKLITLKTQQAIDFVIANAENTSLCRGLNWKDYETLKKNGIDFLTMGNHTWHKNDIYEILAQKNDIIRPYNIRSDCLQGSVGTGSKVVVVKNQKIQITNLIGKSIPLNDLQTNPFCALDQLLESVQCDFHIVDFHAETTSEKNAFFKAFQGKVSAILGTHTHVQTNDARIVNNTAYISDVGMCGPCDGVIGAESCELIPFFKEEKTFFRLKEAKGNYQFCGVILSFCCQTKIPVRIQTIYQYEKA